MHDASPIASAALVALRCAAVAGIRGLQLSLACSQIESLSILSPRGSPGADTRRNLSEYASFFVEQLPGACRAIAAWVDADGSESDVVKVSNVMSRAGVLHVAVAAECFALVRAGAAEDIADLKQRSRVAMMESKV